MKVHCKTALTPNGKYLSVDVGSPTLQREDLVFLTELVEAGKLQPVIDRSYPLEHIAAWAEKLAATQPDDLSTTERAELEDHLFMRPVDRKEIGIMARCLPPPPQGISDCELVMRPAYTNLPILHLASPATHRLVARPCAGGD